jgi:two-component system LytT family response regulator
VIDAIVVDDEPHARTLLRVMLAEHPDVDVVGEYGTGTEALAAIRRDAPDLVLLDIQMPGLTGIEVAEAIAQAPDPLPSIVFVTAYDEYAIQAFEIHAVDYLLKPVDPARLERALERVRARVSAPLAGDQLERLQRMLDAFAARERRTERIAIRVGERTYLQRTDEIEWVEAEGKHMKIHVGGKSYAMRETMRNVETRLDPTRFIRVSRSAMVNLDHVREIQPWFNGDFVLILRSGTEVTTTRAYRDQLREVIARASG